MRVALLSYRSKPFCGGQGIYVRYLSRELVAAGHEVEVISGPPYPILDPGVGLTKLPSLDLYRDPDPFRIPHPREFRSPIDALEFAIMCTAGFPEPLTFTLRAWRHLKDRVGDFDVVHDNQSFGYGMLGIQRLGIPVVATMHHPVTVDRRVELAQAPLRRKIPVRRWYGFTKMQGRVMRRIPYLATVSENSLADIVTDYGVDPERLRVIPVGVDTEIFRPYDVPKVPGRVITTASADVPLKGLVHLLEAMAKVLTERDAELIVVGSPKAGGVAERTLDRLGLRDSVRWVSGITDAQLAELISTAEVAVVPSLYEGFSLPAIEAMAVGTTLVATTGGALPEVVGPDGETALHVPPADPDALALAIGRVLDDSELRDRIGEGGYKRALQLYTWAATAAQTAEWYADSVADHRMRQAAAERPC